LFTAAAALDVFGADHTFTTRVVAKSKAKDGTIDGPLYLVGGGDPLLMTDDFVAAMGGHRNTHSSLEKLADDVVAAGVKTVHGGVVGDDARFDKERYLPSWEAGYRTGGQVGPISAVSVNQGFGTFSAAGKTAADDPAVSAAAKFAELLVARGVTVEQPAIAGVVPDNTSSIAELASPPMAAMIGEMLTESDNSTAEVILKNLGVEVFKRGTFADGVKAVLGKLQEDGLPLGGVQLVDGSGLDRSDRVTCNAIAAVLARGGSNGVIGSGMAKAGESGTLATRLNNTPAVGHLQAKTGTLSGVSALAGWARPDGQQPFNFVVITNGVAGPVSRTLEDQVAVLLAGQPSTAPSANAFAPEGVAK
jgi:D-alanyl-D-alanine carboxypeptidase/D-alanyl-D-alanine-endopeptidase (penicillin-binding protein 4)